VDDPLNDFFHTKARRHLAKHRKKLGKSGARIIMCAIAGYTPKA
jgi:hypothetical protein